MTSMRMTVLGCSGSVAGPDSPASGYLLTAPDTPPPLVIDFGPGVLGALQRHADPGEVSILLSHLHADHCLDIPGLLVWRRYSPEPAGRACPPLYGPSDAAVRLGVASAECAGEVDDLSDTLDLNTLTDGGDFRFGALTVQPPAASTIRPRHTDSGSPAIPGAPSSTPATPACATRSSNSRAAPTCCSPKRRGHTIRSRAPPRTCICPAPKRDRSPRAPASVSCCSPTFRRGRRARTSSPKRKNSIRGPVHAVSAGDVYRI